MDDEQRRMIEAYRGIAWDAAARGSARVTIEGRSRCIVFTNSNIAPDHRRAIETGAACARSMTRIPRPARGT